ncbi:MAG TPA: hypothetical protein VF173_09795 [Thermoanaerobaculia bacterium]|nr:hypothetical protein [Thermoanaerobaculia bacterium]
MSRKLWMHAALVFTLLFAGTQAASAKILFSYAVKFVCGYNPSNIGIMGDALDQKGGEPTVKFGNYATDINIYNFNIYADPATFPQHVEKSILLLVEKGIPVGREKRIAKPILGDVLDPFPPGGATMDDCNRIAEMLWGVVPTPYPLTIGYLVLGTTIELDVTAVYTAQTCSNWLVSPEKLDCLNPDSRTNNSSVSIDVVQITGHKLGG